MLAMAIEKIDSYVDRAEFRSDTEFILAQLKQAADAFNKIAATKLSLGGASTTKQTAEEIKRVTAETERLIKVSNQSTSSYEKSAKAIIAEARAREANTKAATAEIRQQEASGRAAVQEAKARTEAARAAAVNAQATLSAAKSSTERARAAALEATAIKELAAAEKNEALAKKAAAQTDAIVAREREKSANAAKKEADAIAKSSNAYEQLKRRQLIAANTAKQLGAEFGTTSRYFKDAAAQASKLDRELSKLERAVGQNQRNVGNYGGALRSFGRDALYAAGAVIGISSAFEALRFAFNTNLQFDSLNTAIRQLSGTQQEFAINQSFIKKTSDDLGLSLVDLTRSFKNFYAASTTAGLTSTTTRTIFEQVSSAAASLKLSQDEVNGVFTAFGQIISKGKVQAEELRGQIGERIPGAFAIAAKSIGVTGQELDKMLKKGEVIAADFLPKFASELEKTFGGNVEKVEGLQAAINRFNNTLASIVNDESGGLNQFFTKTVNFFTNAFQGAEKFFQLVFNNIDPTAAKLKNLSAAFGDAYNEQSTKNIDEITEALKRNSEQLEKDLQNYKQTAATAQYYGSDQNKRDAAAAYAIVTEQEQRVLGIRQALRDKGRKDLLTSVDLETAEEKKARERAAKKAIADAEKYAKELALARRLIAENARLEIPDGPENPENDPEALAIKQRFEKRRDELEKGRDILLKANEEKRGEGIISEEKFGKEELRIADEYNGLILKAEIDTTEQIIALAKLRGEDVTKEEAELYAIKLKYAQLTNSGLKVENDKALADAKKFAEERRKLQEELAEALADLVLTLGTSTFDRQKNEIQDQIDLIEKKKAADIEAINASTATEEEKANRIQILNARTQAQKEQLELRQRQLDQRRAQFEKAATIARIIADTAVGSSRVDLQACKLEYSIVSPK